jgi:transcriptional regulator with XRE-family HTH domain
MEKTPRERLRAFRKSRKLTLDALAELIGCAPSSLSMIEQGARMPGLRTALGIERESGIKAREWHGEAAR